MKVMFAKTLIHKQLFMIKYDKTKHFYLIKMMGTYLAIRFPLHVDHSKSIITRNICSI